jgi:hypothetical protein
MEGQVVHRAYAAIVAEAPPDYVGDAPADNMREYSAFGWNLSADQVREFLDQNPGEKFHIMAKVVEW